MNKRFEKNVDFKVGDRIRFIDQKWDYKKQSHYEETHYGEIIEINNEFVDFDVKVSADNKEIEDKGGGLWIKEQWVKEVL